MPSYICVKTPCINIPGGDPEHNDPSDKAKYVQYSWKRSRYIGAYNVKEQNMRMKKYKNHVHEAEGCNVENG